MKKLSVALIGILAVFLAASYLWTASLAKRKSDDIMSKFREINNHLASSGDTIMSENGHGAIQTTYQISSTKSQLILLIDSIEENYENMRPPVGSGKMPTQLRSDIKRLLRSVQQFNQLKWNFADSAIPDTIKYWSESGKFSEQKWFSTYFENAPKEAAITYLNDLRDQILATN